MIVATTNSIYYLDRDAKKWKRIDKTGDSGNLPTEDGDYTEEIQLEVGAPMILMCPPIKENAISRLVITSPVLSISDATNSN